MLGLCATVVKLRPEQLCVDRRRRRPRRWAQLIGGWRHTLACADDGQSCRLARVEMGHMCAPQLPVGLPISICEHQVMRLSVALSHPVFNFPNELCGDGNESVLSGFILALALETELAPRLRLNMLRAFLPVEVRIFRFLHFGIPNSGIQEQTVEQFLLVVHGCKHVLEFMLRVRLRWLLGVVKLRQNLAGDEDVPRSQERVQGFEDCEPCGQPGRCHVLEETSRTAEAGCGQSGLGTAGSAGQ